MSRSGDFTADILGLIATAGTITISYQSEIEWGLRMLSLMIGITVGILSIIHIYQKIRKEKKLNQDEKNNSDNT